MNISLCSALLLALAASSCQSAQQRIAVEWRMNSTHTQEDLYQDANRPVGGALVVHSLPIQGAKNQFGWEIGYGEASDSFDLPVGKYTLRQRDAWLGLRYTFLDGHVRPYLGAGGQYTEHEVTLEFGGAETKPSTDDIGPYGEAGLLVRVNQALHVVAGYRETFGLRGRFDAVELDLDSSQVFLGLGWSF